MNKKLVVNYNTDFKIKHVAQVVKVAIAPRRREYLIYLTWRHDQQLSGLTAFHGLPLSKIKKTINIEVTDGLKVTSIITVKYLQLSVSYLTV